MRTITQQLSDAFRGAISKALSIDADPLIASSQNPAFGDYQSNAAMGLAKRAAEASGGGKPNPRATAEKIVAALELGDIAQEVSIAGPGFINVRLSPAWVAKQLQEVANSDRLGIDPATQPVRTVVDYSGPNIAKQMHVGHLRSTIIGDAIARVLEFLGNEVIRQNHIGDWGTQFGMLITHLRDQEHAGGEAHISDLEEFYQQAKRRFDEDEAFQNESRATVVRLQSGAEAELKMWKTIVEETRRHYQPIYEKLGVALRPEHERGESFYNPLLPSVVQDLKDSGIAVPSEGAIAVFTEGFGAPLLIQKSDGGYLYATTDLAAIRFRTRTLGAQRLIYVHDSRQSQHFAQVFSTAKRAGWAEGVQLEYAPFGTMLGEDNRPFKTRTGGTVKLKDLLDEADQRAFDLVSAKNPALAEEKRRSIAAAVGIGAIKYADLSKDRTNDYVFSWEKMLSMDGNTGPYLQYAHTRIQSIFRKAAEAGEDQLSAASELVLEKPQELSLAKHLLRFSEVLDTMARELKPHHLCGYLYELATLFSSFYENCPVLQSQGSTRSSRLHLCSVASRTLATGLQLLGIQHPEQM